MTESSDHQDEGLDRASTIALTASIDALTQEMRTVTTVVQTERRGRRLTQALFGVAMLALVAAGSTFAISITTQRSNEAVNRCARQVESRADTRAAIVATIDEVLLITETEDPMRTELIDRVGQRVLSELPPPDC